MQSAAKCVKRTDKNHKTLSETVIILAWPDRIQIDHPLIVTAALRQVTRFTTAVAISGTGVGFIIEEGEGIIKR